jgi:hypothetical protein
MKKTPEYNVIEQYIIECITKYDDAEKYKFMDEEDYPECGNCGGNDW